jgi:hypothetical protein
MYKITALMTVRQIAALEKTAHKERDEAKM